MESNAHRVVAVETTSLEEAIDVLEAKFVDDG